MPTTIPDDDGCAECGAQPQRVTCDECGATALITDCGHMMQPRPIAAGRADGSDLASTYCDACAGAGAGL